MTNVIAGPFIFIHSPGSLKFVIAKKSESAQVVGSFVKTQKANTVINDASENRWKRLLASRHALNVLIVP